jgi:hypothetical protein
MATVAETDFLYQTESRPLVTALQAIVRESRIVSQALTSGSAVTPVPLRTALDEAAAACEQGGIPIRWFGD